MARLERAEQPLFLTPQYRKTAKGWTIQSAVDYAKICNAVYNGVHATLAAGERVACGVTSPRGNNNPNSARASVSPLAFLRAVKKAGLKTFDAWAHHPYYEGPSDQPTTKPVTAKGAPATAVTLGNISDLIHEVTRLYGNKRILDHRVRLPDESAGQALRRLVHEAGLVPHAGVRARAEEPADRHDAVVPAEGRAGSRRVAVRSRHVRREAQARLQRLHPDGGSGKARCVSSSR
jgi:hypothetical protein